MTASERRWIFIGGIRRSGTALLAELLSRAPGVRILRETGFAVSLYHLLTFAADAQEDKGYAITQMRGHYSGRNMTFLSAFARLALSVNDAETTPAMMVRGMCEDLWARHWPNAVVCGDKCPTYCNDWPIVNEVFPGAIWFATDRDTEAAARSAHEQWGRSMQITRRNAIAMRNKMKQCPDAHWVQLEELNAAPREVFGRVLEHAGISPQAYPWDGFDTYFEFDDDGNPIDPVN